MAARQRRVNVNPCSEALQVPDGRARQTVVAALLWWHLRRHRSARRGSLEEGQPLLAPGAVALQVTLSAIGLQAVPPALTSAALPALHRCPSHPTHPRAHWLCPPPGMCWHRRPAPLTPSRRRLDLSFNDLGSLSGGGGGLAWLTTGLPYLEELNLASNRLSTLPSELGELESLRCVPRPWPAPGAAQDTHPRRGAACFAWAATACVRCPRS